jgi:NADH-quinone oxidoreductase subunit J
MDIYKIMFILFSAMIMVFSILTITTRRILRAATFLLIVLIATAGIYVWLEYEFLAAVQLTLYAGGIVVIIIFSILLTHHIHHKFEPPGMLNLISGIGVGVLGAALAISTILSYNFQGDKTDVPSQNVKEIGMQLVSTGHNGYSLPFEVISVLLLAALIGAIVIAKKDPSNSENKN